MFSNELIRDQESILYKNLHELREWAAVGFYQGQALAYPRAYGLALRRLYENMDIAVPPTGMLVPCEPFPTQFDRERGNAWYAEGLILGFYHNTGLCVQTRIVEEKRKTHPHLSGFIDELAEDLRYRLDQQNGGYTHSNPDIGRVVSEGIGGMEAELDQELSATLAQGQDDGHPERSLLLALKDYVAGIRSFHGRAVEAVRLAARSASVVREQELTLLADTLQETFLVPAKGFYAGLLSVNFAWMLDGCDSIGRVDQVLGGLLRQDLEQERVSLPFVRALLDEWFRRFEQYNGWNLQVGGRTRAGKDGCNLLTEEILRACSRNTMRRPNVAFRVTSDTPESMLDLAMEALGNGAGRPALYNDDLYIKSLLELDLGLTPEDATEVSFGGCTETMIGGLSHVGSLDGRINVAKALELAVNDGVCMLSGKREGPRTGLFPSFGTYGEFEAAVREQAAHMIVRETSRQNAVIASRFSRGEPKIARTFFIRDCVRKRKSFEAGGARYNWSAMTFCGISTLLDSLTAIRVGVFETGTISPEELLAALRSDFENAEALCRKLSSFPKYGNGNTEEDARSIRTFAAMCETLLRQPHARASNGRYLPACIEFATYEGSGQQVAATPDGRRSQQPLGDSVGAYAGRDLSGPTALMRSVASLPLNRMAGTPVLNLRFQKDLFQTAETRGRLTALLLGFFRMGGMQAQLSVLDHTQLLAARKNPQDYPDLIVRIGGYSEKFIHLTDGLKDTVIARTEYTSSCS